MTSAAETLNNLRALCQNPIAEKAAEQFLREARQNAARGRGPGAGIPSIPETFAALAHEASDPKELAALLCFALLPRVLCTFHSENSAWKPDSEELIEADLLASVLRAYGPTLYSRLAALGDPEFDACLDAVAEILLHEPSNRLRSIRAVLLAQPFYSRPDTLSRFLSHQARNDFPMPLATGVHKTLQFVYLDAALQEQLPEHARALAADAWKKHPHLPYRSFHILGQRVRPADLLLRQHPLILRAADSPHPAEADLKYIHQALRQTLQSAEAAPATEIDAALAAICCIPADALEAALTLRGAKKLFEPSGHFLNLFDLRRRGATFACRDAEFRMLEFYERLAPKTFANDFLYLIRTLIRADCTGERILDADGAPNHAFARATLSKALQFNSLEAILDLNVERLGPEELHQAALALIGQAHIFAEPLRSALEKKALAKSTPMAHPRSAQAADHGL